MATKKKRGLSGSRESLGYQSHEHWDFAESAFSRALKFSESAHSKAIKGKCFDSFGDIINAHEEIGEAVAHSMASNRGEEFDEAREEVALEIADAESVFNKKCLVGGGLSGMKRRSRR